MTATPDARTIALVLAGGDVRRTPRLRALVQQATVIIAVDGGLRHAQPLGVVPSLLVGDFDSVSEGALDRWPQVPIERSPTDKDELDLELGIEAALARGADEVRVVGAFGGRLDQTLAAAAIAARYAENGARVSLLDGRHDAHPLAAGMGFSEALPSGTIFSLLAISDQAQVDVVGAAYALDATWLPRGVGRGVSNQTVDDLEVRVRKGTALLIIEWDVAPSE